MSPQTVLEAIGRPPFLRSVWPWRAFAYAATTAVTSGLLWLALSGLIAPLLLAGHLIDQEHHVLVAVPAALAGLVLLGACLPPLAVGFGHVERERLRLADRGPIGDRRGGNLYRAPETWRAIAYLVVLAVAPVWLGLIALAGILEFALVAAPLAVHLSGPIVIGTVTVHSVGPAALLSVVGLLLLLPLAYVVAGLAGAHAGIARRLLVRDHPSAKS